MPAISVSGDTNAHGGAPFNTGLSSTVLAGNKGIALAGQTGSTANDDLYNKNKNAHPTGIAANQTASIGSTSVFINNKQVHRVGDPRIDGTTAGPGEGTVIIGAGGASSGAYAPTSVPGNPTFTTGSTASFKGTPDPSIFVLDANGNPFSPTATARPGIDYAVVEFTPGIYTLVNLHDYTPDSTNVQPIAPGNGIVQRFTIDGLTFDTASFYTLDQFDAPLYAFGNLSKEERFALISEYGKQNNVDFMTNGDYGPNSNPAYYESDSFKNFLASKGLG